MVKDPLKKRKQSHSMSLNQSDLAVQQSATIESSEEVRPKKGAQKLQNILKNFFTSDTQSIPFHKLTLNPNESTLRLDLLVQTRDAFSRARTARATATASC